ncbi:MAG TPA: gamma-glutamyl-gamma-aminobutyrate hydrolase family protein [Polyangia bacterium]|nr:gamma-glutamyl-gamma-aminobutyrate hydrolase family protein [Polyangia bacterium]
MEPSPIKSAVVLQHAPTEGPGRVADLLAEQGVAVSCRQVYAGEPVPGHLDDDALLVVMGGPMGVGDAGDRRYPFLGREIALLQQLVAADRPVLGICLGAQLLAAGGGARVYPNRRPDRFGNWSVVREVGWGPVDFLGVDREPALVGLRALEMMLHWHGDTFDLPAGAVHLASTPACPHQAFRLGTCQFALQFHCELDADTIIRWVSEDAAFVRAANGVGGGRQIIADTVANFPAAQPMWDQLLRNILGVLLHSPGGQE